MVGAFVEQITDYFHLGSKEQKERYIPDLASGKTIGCFGLTEPNHGSNPGRHSIRHIPSIILAGMETKAKWDDKKGVYRLSGTKTWISNSPVADVFIVWARSDKHNNAVKVGNLFALMPVHNSIQCRASFWIKE